VSEQTCICEHKREPDRPRRALDSLYVCGGHRKGLAFNLLDLPGMYERLTERHTARTGGHSEIRTGGHAGLSLQDRVARARGNIYTGLSGWARIVASERGFRLPVDDVRAIATWLVGRNGGQLDWLCAQPWVDEAVDTMDVLHREAFVLLYPRGRRRFEVGDCIEVTSCDVATRDEQRCPGRMLATITDQDDELPSSLYCSDCGLDVSADRWITWGRQYRKAMGVSA
jgi:hypothetical protein